MRLIYLAHPVRGDVAGNLARARRWWRWAVSRGVAVCAPWITECELYDDADEAQRGAAMARNLEALRRCDELWLVGGRISVGMIFELEAARRARVAVVDYTGWLGEEPPVPTEEVTDRG